MRHRLLNIYGLALLFVFLSSSSFAIVKGEYVISLSGDFITGNDYRKMNEAEQKAYLVGVFDGIMLVSSSELSDKNNPIMKLNSCTDGLDSDQLRAVVNKEMNKHPENWNMSMGLTVYGAMTRAFLK